MSLANNNTFVLLLFLTLRVSAKRADVLGPKDEVPASFVVVARIILNQLDLYDLNEIHPSTYGKLPKQSILSSRDLLHRFPPSVYRNLNDVDRITASTGIADLLNQIPTKTLHRIGGVWLKIMGRLPVLSWRQLDDRVIDNMPWQGLVANMEPRVWGKMHPWALNRFPERFWRRTPLKVWFHVSPKTWARIAPRHFNEMRVGYVKRLPWRRIVPFLPSAHLLNNLDRERQDVLNWWHIAEYIGARAFAGLQRRLVLRVPAPAWKYLSINHVRALRPSVLGRVKTSALLRVSPQILRSLNSAQKRAIGRRRLRALIRGVKPKRLPGHSKPTSYRRLERLNSV